MRRGEHQGRGLRDRPQDLEGGAVGRGHWVGRGLRGAAHVSLILALDRSGLDHNDDPVTRARLALSGGACKAAGFGITSEDRDAADRRGAAEGA